ncbi:unnamed protein product [Trichogramma brassicae]|uniref:Peptidase aspartic putative domain-containing protein n=1 Tax=Trichogramma brassicae TaxID=86971 RepID=A0A6H5J0A2_9HYME|nr:unnamed protein product [Trichogramma brassicae]
MRPAQTGVATPTLQLSTTATSLPKLTLPKFSGLQQEWDTFKALFTSMVKDAPTLTPTLKLQHLFACVEGDTLRTIKSIEVTGDNFEVAWTALSRRYENKRLRISLFMKRLLYMQPATKKSVAEYTRLLDTTNECRRALRSLGEPVDQWDRWFVSIIVFNLDSDTREKWEQHIPAGDASPTYDQLVAFLENKVQALDTAHCSNASVQNRSAKSNKVSSSNSSKFVSAHHASSNSESSARKQFRCVLCSGEHRLGSCTDFNGYTTEQRWKYVKEQGLCFNCLSKAHKSAECTSTFKCRTCQQLHHSKLHRGSTTQDFAAPPTTEAISLQSNSLSTHVATSAAIASHTSTNERATILGTARARAVNTRGEELLVRVLTDPASEGSFVSEHVVQMLALQKKLTPLSVSGAGARHQRDAVGSLKGLALADPLYHTPAPVDCLIGAELYPEIIKAGLRLGPIGSPMAYDSIFGWIVTGPTDIQQAHPDVIGSFKLTVVPMASISHELRKFWELEEVQLLPTMTPAEEECENFFRSTHRRDETGRFVVCLPFTAAPAMPGAYAIAQQRFLALERRLLKNPELRQQYCKFMQDYEDLNHMRKAEQAQTSGRTAYIPHHAVVGKKLRVVFNASQKANNGKSLNDFLHVGGKLQPDIAEIILRWRLGRYAFTADIIKMYRQIRIHDEDIPCQRILWRKNPEDPVQEYELLTVTYGTACAPYLALRVMRQLAEDGKVKHPVGSKILRQHVRGRRLGIMQQRKRGYSSSPRFDKPLADSRYGARQMGGQLRHPAA